MQRIKFSEAVFYDPSCRGSSSLKLCSPGSQDPGCLSEQTENIVKSCEEGSTSPECLNSEQENELCRGGPGDPECQRNEQDKEKTGMEKNCIPGSQEENCTAVDEEEILKEKEEPLDPDTIKTNTPCLTGDHNCGTIKQKQRDPKQLCTPGSNNPQCRKSEPKLPDPDSENVCIEGSGDPRCWPVPVTDDPLAKCVPGSKDPHCLRLSENPEVNFDPLQHCLPGSEDPACRAFDNR